MKLHIKRIYDKPEAGDGRRILVDRMWPRGIRKEQAKIDDWAKSLAPPRELIAWYHEDKANRLQEFHRKYKQYLQGEISLARELFEADQTYSIITSVKDIENSHIPVLEIFLDSRIKSQ